MNKNISRYKIFAFAFCITLLTVRTYGNHQPALPVDVSGKVTNEKSEPIPGVTVTVKGSSNSVSTDAGGLFLIRHVPGNAVLVFTSVNMETYEEKLNGRTDLLVVLTPKITSLDLVKVEANLGYYTSKPNEINGSVAIVDNKTLNQQSGTNILDRLKGVTSGLWFDNKQPNNPQSKLNIYIRGLGTINGPLDPLIVLDNFVYEGNINNINPNDIESVSVLKDAASTSIYGARGGNGVIVITTKKSKYNQPLKIDINTNLIIHEKPDLYYLPQISSADYIEVEQFLYRNGYYNSLINFDWYYHTAFTPALQTIIQKRNGLISAADSASQIDALKAIDTRDEYKRFFYCRAFTQQYSLLLRGGGNSNTYVLSVNYDNNRGSLHEQFNKLNLRAQNTFRPFKNFEASLGIFYTNSRAASGRPGTVKMGNRQVPYLKLADHLGNALPVAQQYSDTYTDTLGAGKLMDWKYYPLEDYNHDRTTTGIEEIVGNIGLNYQILKGLKIELSYQYQKQTGHTKRTAGTGSFYARDLINRFSQLDRATGVVKYIVPQGGIMNLYYSDLNSKNLRAQLNYSRTWNAHSLMAIAGAEQREVANSGNSNSIYGYSSDPLSNAAVDFVNSYPTFVNGSYQTIPGKPVLSDQVNRFVSFYSNFSYAYKQRYTASASARKDGSNIFGSNTNDKWKPLWSAGLGWNISKERFYVIPAIPYLRLKATWGYSGNVDVSRSALPVAFNTTASLTNLPITRVVSINNPELRWEKVRQLNIGLEFASRNQILSGTVEYYVKKGTDLYGETPFDYTTWGSASEIIKNVADMKGKGFDISVQSRNLDGNLKWTTGLLFNYNTTKTTKYYTRSAQNGLSLLGGGNSITPVIGKPLYAIAGYKWGGLNSSGDPQGFLDGQKSTDYDAIFKSIDSKGLNSENIVFLGAASPMYFGSLINTVEWNGLALSLNIAYKFGYWFRKTSLAYDPLFRLGLGHSDFKKRWQKPGDENFTDIPSLVYTTYPGFSDREAFYSGAAVHVLKGDHIRLQYINLDYSFSKIGSGTPIKALNIYFNIANLGIIWKANKQGIDPDFPSSIPASRSYTLGIRAGF